MLTETYQNIGRPLNTESGEVKLTCQVRDAALLALIECTGQNSSDYGFKHLRPNPTLFYDPDTVGFTTDVDRTQALNRWKTWRDRHRYDELKPNPDASEGVLL